MKVSSRRSRPVLDELSPVKSASARKSSAKGLRVLILSAEFNARVVDGLVAGARKALGEMGAAPGSVELVQVPGAFELPQAAAVAARAGRFDAIVALGAVIRGDTDHYEHVAREVSTGLAEVARASGVPVGFGVLTVREAAQALARCAPGPGNKGAEAARAAIAMVEVLRLLGPPKASGARRKRTHGA
jgi:6,7-dimethyl-8-ribityllumazine synthase